MTGNGGHDGHGDPSVSSFPGPAGAVPPGAELYAPDGATSADALARTTDLGIVAHPDDLEFGMLVPIGHCADDPERWFTGVVCTDGAGSARAGDYAAVTDEEMVVIRAEEQREAARVGRYGAVVQLGRPSPVVRSEAGSAVLVDDLAALIDACRPMNLYTHNLADKHTTHVAVGLAVVRAIRMLPPMERPVRVVGVEGWRSLDWLGDHEKILLDATGLDDLAAALAACFPSQIAGGKRYDVAEEGRRRANATLREPREIDDAEQLTVAMDLTPLVRNDDLDPVVFLTAAVDRLRADVERVLRALR